MGSCWSSGICNFACTSLVIVRAVLCNMCQLQIEVRVSLWRVWVLWFTIFMDLWLEAILAWDLACVRASVPNGLSYTKRGSIVSGSDVMEYVWSNASGMADVSCVGGSSVSICYRYTLFPHWLHEKSKFRQTTLKICEDCIINTMPIISK